MDSPSKKQRTRETQDLKEFPIDCIGDVMEYCKTKERLLVSSTCTGAKKLYDGGLGERVSKRALAKMVRQRKEDWEFPTMDLSAVTWDECLPPILKNKRSSTFGYISRIYMRLFEKFECTGDEDVDMERSEALDDAMENDPFVNRIFSMYEMQNAFQLGDNVYEVFKNMHYYDPSYGGSDMTWDEVVHTVIEEKGTLLDLLDLVYTEFHGNFNMYTFHEQ